MHKITVKKPQPSWSNPDLTPAFKTYHKNPDMLSGNTPVKTVGLMSSPEISQYSRLVTTFGFTHKGRYYSWGETRPNVSNHVWGVRRCENGFPNGL